MLAQRRKDSPLAVLFMSSVVDRVPLPWLSSYSGSKAFLRQFANSLREELRQEGAGDVQLSVVSPFLVRTPMTNYSKDPWAVESKEVVLDAFASLQ